MQYEQCCLGRWRRLAEGGVSQAVGGIWLLRCFGRPAVWVQAEMRRRRQDARGDKKGNNKAVRMPGKEAANFD